MSQLAMPMLVTNLGCEMLYILEQRLKAQSIPADKSCKVLNDVVKTMFDPGYVEKLFTPQEMYTVSQTRKIFDRLAHSSIMRLSESSMDKLFDLMTMGFKYQILCSTRLDQVLEVTQRHLTSVKGMIESLPDKSTVPLVTAMEAAMNKAYKPLTAGQQVLLRHTLLRFFQDRRVKVSLFLQEGIQSSMGRIILPSPLSQYAGTVTYYDLAGGLESQDKLKIKATSIDPQEFFVHPAPLGTNLYNKERGKVVPPPRKGDAITAPLKPEEEYKTAADEYAGKGDAGARKELTLLTALLAIKPTQDNFKLNLFEDLGIDGPSNQGGSAGAGRVDKLTFQGNAAYKAGVLGEAMKGLDVGGGKGKAGGEGEDLLDLLDEAAS